MDIQKKIVNDFTRYCPNCKADWRGEEIPKKDRHLYAGRGMYFSRLVGIERNDRIAEWECPDCFHRFGKV